MQWLTMHPEQTEGSFGVGWRALVGSSRVDKEPSHTLAHVDDHMERKAVQSTTVVPLERHAPRSGKPEEVRRLELHSA